MINSLIPLLHPFASTGTSVGDACTVSSTSPLFGILEPWYYYITTGNIDGAGKCVPSIDLINHLSQIWLIGLAVFEDLLRLAGVIALGFVIYGGIRFLTSAGSPEATKAARGTIINALAGLVIVGVAAAAVSFLASSLS